MAPRPAPRRFPITLLELQSLDDYENVTCLGRPDPAIRRCTATLDPEDELFRLAVQKLQSLSTLESCTLEDFNEGFLRTLQDIAQGFSCVHPSRRAKTHRHMGGQRKQYPYYWVAIFILPEFMECMGFNDLGTRSWSSEKQAMIWSAVDAVHLRDLWILDSAMQRLNYDREGLRGERNDAFTSCFLMAVTERLAKDSGKHEEEANELWKKWHHVDVEQRLQWDGLLQRYPQTPWRSKRAEPQYGSAPQVMQTSGSHDLDVYTPTKSQKRPLPGPLQTIDTSSPQELNTTHPVGKPRAIQSRRASAPLSTVQHFQTYENQRGQVLENESPSDREGMASQFEGEPPESVHSSNEMGEDTTEGPKDSATSETSQDIDPHSRISDNFEIYKDKKPCKIKTIVLRILNLMRQPLNEAVDLKDRYIYAFIYYGYIKIGYAATKPVDREKTIKTCLSNNGLETQHSFYILKVANQKVEKLIHNELSNYRRNFKCKKEKCNGGRGEWFEIDEDKAVKTIRRWKRWMDSRPYDTTRELAIAEELRIDTYEKDEGFAQLLIPSGEDVEPRQWDWDAFMQHTTSDIELLKHYMTRKRPEKITAMSRHRSLKEHWKSNVLLCLGFYWVIMVLRLFANYTSSPFLQGYGTSVFECMVLSGLGALYAA